jgi:hypothetical protein
LLPTFVGDSLEAALDRLRSTLRDLDFGKVISNVESSCPENNTHTSAACLLRHSRQSLVGADPRRLGAKWSRGFSFLQVWHRLTEVLSISGQLLDNYRNKQKAIALHGYHKTATVVVVGYLLMM